MEFMGPIDQGREAARLLDDVTFQHVVEAATQRCIAEWRNDGSTMEEREAAHARITGIDAVLHELRILVDSGLLAENLAAVDA